MRPCLVLKKEKNRQNNNMPTNQKLKIGNFGRAPRWTFLFQTMKNILGIKCPNSCTIRDVTNARFAKMIQRIGLQRKMFFVFFVKKSVIFVTRCGIIFYY